MQRGSGGRDDLFGSFGDPFAGFPGFGRRPGSLISNFFGGRDPFDDPFFTQPFGSLMGPSMIGPSMFGPTMFGSRNPIGETSNAGFLEQQAPFGFQAPTGAGKSKGPIIKEITSDDEEEEREENEEDKKDNPRKHARSSKEPYVLDADEEVEEKRSRTVLHRSEFDRVSAIRSQPQTFSFQSSTVTYGSPNGAYYTANTTRRMGGDGVVMEESKEADSATGKATHRVSKGIHDKGHTVLRKLDSDGRVDSLQTLHNVNEDELDGFHEAWKGKARHHLPGWNQGYDMLDNGSNSSNRNSRNEQLGRGWALPLSGLPANGSSSAGGKSNYQSRSNSSGGGRFH